MACVNGAPAVLDREDCEMLRPQPRCGNGLVERSPDGNTVEQCDAGAMNAPDGSCDNQCRAWRCPLAYIGDGECDCGCGYPDPDCARARECATTNCGLDDDSDAGILAGPAPHHECHAGWMACIGYQDILRGLECARHIIFAPGSDYSTEGIYRDCLTFLGNDEPISPAYSLGAFWWSFGAA